MVEEIISHRIDDYRESIILEYLYSHNNITERLNLEIYLDELESYGELYEDVQWDEYEEENTTTTYRHIDIMGLQETLNSYIEDNPTVLDD